MKEHPLAEVFGFPVENQSNEALNYRKMKFCPYNNRIPNCTKDKANDPLGVCSIYHEKQAIITCPVRFRENWIVILAAASFLFPQSVGWTTLPEIRLHDSEGSSAGNIDYVLVSYDQNGKILDFGSLEIQAVYISGNLRNVFNSYMAEPGPDFKWGNTSPHPDYLSSSRKRLVPQILYKGGIFHNWNKKQVVALQRKFFNTLPTLSRVDKEKAEMAWLLYELVPDINGKLVLTLVETVYTLFNSVLEEIASPKPGSMLDFIQHLQLKLDDKLEQTSPDAQLLDLSGLNL